MDVQKLIRSAGEASAYSYSPYSSFRVGAALLCRDGSIYLGANIENRSYGLTICAERAAFCAAVSSGQREFEAMALICPDAHSYVAPCGACRQVISEFVKPDFTVIYAVNTDDYEIKCIIDLLPYDSLHDLKKNSKI